MLWQKRKLYKGKAYPKEDALSAGGKVNAKELVESFSNWTYKDIKGVTKRPAYKELLRTEY